MGNVKIGRYEHESGKPVTYFANREQDGAVIGLGVALNSDVLAE